MGLTRTSSRLVRRSKRRLSGEPVVFLLAGTSRDWSKEFVEKTIMCPYYLFSGIVALCITFHDLRTMSVLSIHALTMGFHPLNATLLHVSRPALPKSKHPPKIHTPLNPP